MCVTAVIVELECSILSVRKETVTSPLIYSDEAAIISAIEVAKSAVWTQATPRVAAGTRGVGFPKARKGSPACGPSRRGARPCPKPKEVTHATFHAPPSRAAREEYRSQLARLVSRAPTYGGSLS